MNFCPVSIILMVYDKVCFNFFFDALHRNLLYEPMYVSDRLGVTMHPAQPDWTFDEIVKV